MSARGKARKRALDLLYASEMRSESPVVALDRSIEAGEGPTNDYTGVLVRGVVENQDAIVATNEGRVLFVELPASVELLISHTDPGLQGDRSTGGTKPATLETGHEIQVPLFITSGEKVKVDTRDSSYLGRVKG